MEYYRYTSMATPMSDFGHAMMVDNEITSSHYGCNKYMFIATPHSSKKIEELKEMILTAWEEMPDVGMTCEDEEYFSQFSATEIYEMFVVKDIVDSANGFDSGLSAWLWAAVLEPNNIFAVETGDGCIVYDENIRKTKKGI